MPIKDAEANRAYQRAWQQQRRLDGALGWVCLFFEVRAFRRWRKPA